MTAKKEAKPKTINPVAEAVGKEIKKLRTERSMNQSDFAESTGIRQAMDSRYEAGKEMPSLPTLIRIAAGFASTHKGVGELILDIIGPAIAIVCNEFWGEGKPVPKAKAPAKPKAAAKPKAPAKPKPDAKKVKADKVSKKAAARAVALDKPDPKGNPKVKKAKTVAASECFPDDTPAVKAAIGE